MPEIFLKLNLLLDLLLDFKIQSIPLQAEKRKSKISQFQKRPSECSFFVFSHWSESTIEDDPMLTSLPEESKFFHLSFPLGWPLHHENSSSRFASFVKAQRKYIKFRKKIRLNVYISLSLFFVLWAVKPSATICLKTTSKKVLRKCNVCVQRMSKIKLGSCVEPRDLWTERKEENILGN